MCIGLWFERQYRNTDGISETIRIGESNVAKRDILIQIIDKPILPLAKERFGKEKDSVRLSVNREQIASVVPPSQ